MSCQGQAINFRVTLFEDRAVSDELAILRQRDAEPEEFVAHYEFCEACKNDIKSEEGNANANANETDSVVEN